MTVSTTSIRTDYALDGVATNFAFSFPIFAETDLSVWRRGTDGTETLLTLTTNYTVSAGPWTSGGSITTVSTYADGTLIIKNVQDLDQETDYTNGGKFSATSHENAIDKLTMEVQYLQEQLNRCVMLPETEPTTTDNKIPSPTADEIITYNAAATGFTSKAAADASLVTVSTFWGTVLDDTDSNTSLTTLTFQHTATGGVARGVRAKLTDTASFADFGAVGDGTTDDTSAVNTALAAGVKLDGDNLTYAVTGNITLPADTYIKNAKFKQLTPGAAGDVRTLTTSSVNNITLIEVTVDRNGDGTNGALADDAGIWISGGSGHKLIDVIVTGDDMGSGIVVTGASRFRLDRCRVHNIDYSLGSDPGDDRVQGIWIDNSSNFSLVDCEADTLGGNFGSGATTKYSRGIVITGGTRFRVVGCNVESVDQGFDYTGTAGNRQGTTVGCTAKDCYSYGFKAANYFEELQYTGCVADDCDYAGFVASGPAATGSIDPRNITFNNCIATDTGSVGNYSGSNPTGFLVLEGALTGYPRGVRFINCMAYDYQVTPTMVYGFRNQVVIAASGQQFNEAINCLSDGHTTGGFNGMNTPIVQCDRSSAFSVANAAWTSIEWNAEDYDGAAMHDTGSNQELVTIRRDGHYKIEAQVTWAANITGSRRIRVVKNGTAVVGRETNDTNSGSGVDKTTNISVDLWLASGDTIRIEGYQDSGGALNMQSATSFLHVSEMTGYGGNQ